MNRTSRTARFAAAIAAAAVTLGIVAAMTGIAGQARDVELAKATTGKPVLMAVAKR